MTTPDDDRLRIVATRGRRWTIAATFAPIALVWLAGLVFASAQAAGAARGGSVAGAVVLGAFGSAAAWIGGAMAVYGGNAATWTIDLSPQRASLRSLTRETAVPLAAIGRIRFAGGGRGWRYGVLYAGETVLVIPNLMFDDRAFARLEHDVRDFLARHVSPRDETGDGGDQAFLRGDRRIAGSLHADAMPAGLAAAVLFALVTALVAWI